MKRTPILILCVMLAFFAAAAAIIMRPVSSYAAVGREARNKYSAYAERQMQMSENDTKRETEDTESGGRVFWFRIPDGYLNTKPDERKYVSKFNPYDTPDEWAALDSVVERRAVSQVPADIIRIVSTDELLLYCMNYNFNTDLFVYNTQALALQMMRKHCNALDELLKRSDSPASLIKLYKLCDFSDATRRDDLLLRLPYLEAVLAHEDVLKKLTPEQSNELAAVCAERIMEALDDEGGSRSIDSAVRLALLCQYTTDKEFAALFDSCEGLKYYFDEGFVSLDEIGNEELGKIVMHFSKLLSEYKGSGK